MRASVNMHNWSWCEGAQQTLSLFKDQEYVWLPEDFREIVAVQTTNGLNSGFRLTTEERLLQLRALSVSNSWRVPRGSRACSSRNWPLQLRSHSAA